MCGTESGQPIQDSVEVLSYVVHDGELHGVCFINAIVCTVEPNGHSTRAK